MSAPLLTLERMPAAAEECKDAKLWAKCGGGGAGVFAQCEPGSICVRKNKYYYQCRPSDAMPPAGWDNTLFPSCGGSDPCALPACLRSVPTVFAVAVLKLLSRRHPAGKLPAGMAR